MNIVVTRDRKQKMKHTVHVRHHEFSVDEPADGGGEDLGVTPHEVYDSALGACKALTTLWYARRKEIPVEDIRVTVERDDSKERQGVYRLRVTLCMTGTLTDAQCQEMLAVASKFPDDAR
jgi:putative redox protein